MSIHFTTEVEIARRYRATDGYANRAPYDGIAVIEYAYPLCTITGMHGKFRRTDFMDIMHHARGQGASVLIVERAHGHGMPWGRRVDNGPLQGWWQIDLTQLQDTH